MRDIATYVYCVVHREKRPGLKSVAGVPGASQVQVDPIGPRLWLVSATVPLAEYDAQHIQRRLEDLDWVSRVAIAHEAVVERLSRMNGATVVPMKLFTLFSSSARALDEMKGRRRQLQSIVKRIRGADEWGVRITRRAFSKPQRTTPPTSGLAFLTAKKQARDEAQAHVRSAVKAAERVLDELGRLAKETRRHAPPDGATSPPLVNAALLVPSTRKARFRAAVRLAARQCREAGADLTVTGPWPAYNFVVQ